MSELTELPTARVTVATAAGATIATRKLARDGEAISTAFTAPLPDGRYVVTWRVMSRDGHVVKGRFTFRVVSS